MRVSLVFYYTYKFRNMHKKKVTHFVTPIRFFFVANVGWMDGIWKGIHVRALRFTLYVRTKGAINMSNDTFDGCLGGNMQSQGSFNVFLVNHLNDIS